MGLLYDALLPGLGDYMQGNRDRRDQISRRQALTQEEILDGAPAASTMQQGADGLITGVSTPGSGLMQNPNDFNTQRRYGLGLMGNEYTAGLGEDYLRQINAEHIAQPAANLLAQQQNRTFEAKRAQDEFDQQQKLIAEERQQGTAYANQSGALYTDAESRLKGPREAINLLNNVQTTVQGKGFDGMNLTDDTIMVKSLAKLLLPNEAVMEGDISALTTMTGIPAVMKSLAAKIGMGKPLEVHERQQLYDQLFQLGQQRGQEYQQVRSDFEERSQRRNFNVKDVLGTAVEADLQNLNPGGSRPATAFEGSRPATAAEQKAIDAKILELDGPNVVQQFGNWLAN
jgi:hypothetical protein